MCGRYAAPERHPDTTTRTAVCEATLNCRAVISMAPKRGYADPREPATAGQSATVHGSVQAVPTGVTKPGYEVLADRDRRPGAQVDGVILLGLERRDQFALIPDFLFEVRSALANVADGMRIGAARPRQVHQFTEPVRELVLLLATSPIPLFQCLDILIRRVAARLIQCCPVFLVIAAEPRHLPPIWVGRHECALGTLYITGQFLRSVHTEDVLIDAERKDMAVISTDFDAREHQKVMLGSKLFDRFVVPNRVVFRENDRVEPRLLGTDNEVVGVEHAVVRSGPGVCVEINQHRGLDTYYSEPRTRREISGINTAIVHTVASGNTTLTYIVHDGCMEQQSSKCEHRWRYFVNVESRAVRVRECERCGRRAVIPTQLDPLPRQRSVDPVKLSA